MKLIGSRNIGINTDFSDFDYVEIDDREGGRDDVYNERITPIHHCYHYPKDYRMKVALYDTDDNDYTWLYNPEDYKAGVITINPFEHRDKWITKLKTIDLFSPFFFIRGKIVKRTYHLIYNLEALKEGSVLLSDLALERVKKWHRGNVSFNDLEALKKEIMAL